MEGGVLNQPSKRTKAEIFQSLCPYYMFLGMSYEQYWYGKPDMVQAFYETYKYKRKAKNEEIWLQGLYIAEAISAVFSEGKKKYPDKPHDIYPKTEEEKRLEVEKQRQAIIDYFTELKRRWDNNGTNR